MAVGSLRWPATFRAEQPSALAAVVVVIVVEEEAFEQLLVCTHTYIHTKAAHLPAMTRVSRKEAEAEEGLLYIRERYNSK